MVYLSAKSPAEKMKSILESEVLKLMEKYAIESRDENVLPVIRTFGNLAAGPDDQVALLFDQIQLASIVRQQLMPRLDEPFNTHSRGDQIKTPRSVEKETLVLIGNLTAGPDEFLDIMFSGNEDLLDRVVDILANEDYDLKKEACYSILNICEHRQYFLKLPHKRMAPGTRLFFHPIPVPSNEWYLMQCL
ncbi:Importin subunit alpha-7 [Smittium mucronatum]|uniref:Importin subunit alpha-7 n=1 Tax=Smittium mucronatum TaxID=133383 RepID=A0A1R0H7F2_9FUNG|nr:Importin subunit alpha-7 [Smittium mucronatum]